MLRRERQSGRAAKAQIGEYLRQFNHAAIIQGIDARVLKAAVGDGVLRHEEVQRFIPASTVARKVRQGRKLARSEADQIARLLRIKSYACEVFENAELAETWLGEANPALGDRVPTELLSTDEGSRAVETVLRRIDYGDYS